VTVVAVVNDSRKGFRLSKESKDQFKGGNVHSSLIWSDTIASSNNVLFDTSQIYPCEACKRDGYVIPWGIESKSFFNQNPNGACQGERRPVIDAADLSRS
jgi:hypothetical protein